MFGLTGPLVGTVRSLYRPVSWESWTPPRLISSDSVHSLHEQNFLAQPRGFFLWEMSTNFEPWSDLNSKWSSILLSHLVRLSLFICLNKKNLSLLQSVQNAASRLLTKTRKRRTLHRLPVYFSLSLSCWMHCLCFHVVSTLFIILISSLRCNYSHWLLTKFRLHDFRFCQLYLVSFV